MVEAVGGEGEVTELRVSLIGGYRDEAGTSQQVGDTVNIYTISTQYLHSIYTVFTQYLHRWGTQSS